MELQKSIAELLVAWAAILIFLSLEHVVNLQGLTKYSFVLIVLGLSIIFFLDFYLRLVSSVKFINKKVLLSVSHVFIFIGTAPYLEQVMDGYWWALMLVGVLLLNYYDKLVGFFKE